VRVDATQWEIRRVRGRLASLQERAGASAQRTELVDEALQQLGTTVEELRVAEEELRQQNEELVAAREALEVERRRYQDLFEFAPDGYVVTDANGIIQEANRAAGELLRVPLRFLIGKPLGLFVTREGNHTFHTALTQLAREDPERAWELCLQPRDGDPLEVGLKVSTVRDDDGRLVALRWLFRDLSERKRAQALAEADRLKTTLLSVVSHDLQTPLAIIKASAANLRRRLDGAGVPCDTDEIITEIDAEADRLSRLVSDLLDLTRLQAGAWKPVREWHDLPEILGTVLARFENRTAARVCVRLPVDLPMVYVDGVQVGQVLWNLLDNALKYSPGDAVVEVGAWMEDADLCLSVSDRGPGVLAGERERIFMPFYRSAAAGGADGVRGSGLGLAICRDLVEAHGGRIWAENGPDGGAAFRIRLPVPPRVAEVLTEDPECPLHRPDAVPSWEERPCDAVVPWSCATSRAPEQTERDPTHHGGR
jgi:PAS domain S-box-containing protein